MQFFFFDIEGLPVFNFVLLTFITWEMCTIRKWIYSWNEKKCEDKTELVCTFWTFINSTYL